MTHATNNQIWVFGDLRNRQLLDASFKVLTKAVGLARETGDHVVMFLLTTASATSSAD